MAPIMLQTPAFLAPPVASQKSALAARFLSSQVRSYIPLPRSLTRLFRSESQEQWITAENLVIACLKTGDDESARQILLRLVERFGEDNERVQTLRSLYNEATATDNKGLSEVLLVYDDILKKEPTNMSIRKRKVACLRSMGRKEDAVRNLTELLDVSPTDLEAWAELADLYYELGLHAQSVFCLEEVLLCTPNAWNIHARLGETTMVLAAAATDSAGQMKQYTEAMRRFCRSVELCDDYLRGYYGLKLSTDRILELMRSNTKMSKAGPDADGVLPPLLGSVQGLNELATSKLGEIVRRASAAEKGWDGYDPDAVRAARELLQKSTEAIQR